MTDFNEIFTSLNTRTDKLEADMIAHTAWLLCNLKTWHDFEYVIVNSSASLSPTSVIAFYIYLVQQQHVLPASVSQLPAPASISFATTPFQHHIWFLHYL